MIKLTDLEHDIKCSISSSLNSDAFSIRSDEITRQLRLAMKLQTIFSATLTQPNLHNLCQKTAYNFDL